MRSRHWLLVGWTVLAVASAACQASPAAPTSTPPLTRTPALASQSPSSASPSSPSPVASARPASPVPASPPVTAVPVGASRARVLASADEALAGGNLQSAADLYQRVLNTPPDPSESPSLVAAENGLAGFRSVLVDALRGDESAARTTLQSLQSRTPDSAFARLAAQFWDQYGMTADARAACAQVTPQATQVAAELRVLQDAGVSVESSTLCSVPG